MSTHTPGPWKIENGHIQQSGIAYWQITDGADAICCNQFCYADNSDANARLIAAAPDLLEALKRLAVISDGIYVRMSDGEARLMREAWEKADAAIAKAEGRS